MMVPLTCSSRWQAIRIQIQGIINAVGRGRDEGRPACASLWCGGLIESSVSRSGVEGSLKAPHEKLAHAA